MKFRLDFFKQGSGKWYTSGELGIDAATSALGFYAAVNQIRDLHKRSALPGVSSGGAAFDVVATPVSPKDVAVMHLFRAPRPE